MGHENCENDRNDPDFISACNFFPRVEVVVVEMTTVNEGKYWRV